MNRSKERRNRELARLVILGETYEAVGIVYDITRERVRGITRRLIKQIAPDFVYDVKEIRKQSHQWIKEIDKLGKVDEREESTMKRRVCPVCKRNISCLPSGNFYRHKKAALNSYCEASLIHFNKKWPMQSQNTEPDKTFMDSLSVRASNCIIDYYYDRETFGGPKQIADTGYAKLSFVRNMGHKTLDEISIALEKFDYIKNAEIWVSEGKRGMKKLRVEYYKVRRRGDQWQDSTVP